MKVVNVHNEKFTHYVGRPSALGNPFKLGVHGTREEVIARFEDWARRNSVVLTLIRQLPEDAVLGCYCKPMQCHGDAIVKIWKELHT